MPRVLRRRLFDCIKYKKQDENCVAQSLLQSCKVGLFSNTACNLAPERDLNFFFEDSSKGLITWQISA